MAMSADLIQKLNRIQDLFSSLGYDPIELPKIVVVGSQSAGKSSVLESLVKRSFLPRGTGIVTRCPLVLQLNRCPLGDKRRAAKGVAEEEWGEFLHDEGTIFEMEEICDEIERRTDEITGGDKCIVRDAITLKVFSPHVVDLTLVDLPGMTKVPVGDQPPDIENQINSLIDEYISNSMTIILAVVTANTDMATNESLKFAKSFDPEGKRTLAVLTKVDLMDQGTDARDTLSGKVIPVKLGIIGVVNRSQKDIQENKSMEEAQADEKKFFHARYPDMAARNGTTFLAKRLSELLAKHISSNLPVVKAKIDEEVRHCLGVLSDCGESVTDKKATLMTLISEFTRSFDRLCETGPRDLKSTKLLGGAKICDILHSELEKTFATFHPCTAYDRDTVIMAIRQSNALKPPFFVSEAAFELLVKPQIQKMELPALQCVEDIKKELIKITHLCIPGQLKLRFPDLRLDLMRVVQSTIEKKSKKALDTIKDLIEMQVGHITYDKIDVLKEEFQELMSTKSNEELENPFKEGHRRSDLKRKRDSATKEVKAEISAELKLLKLSDKDIKHVVILGKMLDHYFKIVADSVQDSTAKAVVTFYVHKVRDSLNGELCMQLLKEDRLDLLFQESADVTVTRDDNQRRLEALRRATAVLDGDCSD